MAADPKLPFELASGERLVLFRPAGSVRGIGLTSGRLWLTDRRMYFQPVVFWAFWIAPLVGLMMWALARPHRRDIPLGDIEKHARVKFGRNPNMLRLGTRAGVDLNYIVDDFEPFATALDKQSAFTSKAITT